ncbi:MAG: aminotransferase class IV [Acidimicrobiia bacterium]
MSGALTSSDVLIDGVPLAPDAALISVLDISVLRGYGCFEALRSYGGVPFRLEAHLERLEAGAAALRLPLPERPNLAGWVRDVAAAAGDAVVRLVVTGGTDGAHPGNDTRVVVFAEALPAAPLAYRIVPLMAPWHAAGGSHRLAGVKTTSYAAHVAATLEAKERGFDAALLVASSGEVLEGPTFSVGWVRGGTVEIPSLDLGILASITRSAVIEAGEALRMTVTEVREPLQRLLGAEEVFVMSTVREVAPVVAVGDVVFAAGPVTASLSSTFSGIVQASTLSP